MNSNNGGLGGVLLATLSSLIVVGVVALFALLAAPDMRTAKSASYGSAVKVEVDNGHGSGVYVGNGYVITAAHVTKDAQHIKVVTEDGHGYFATLMWEDPAYDVAVIRIDPKAKVNKALFSCRAHPEPYPGTWIEAVGTPLSLGFVRTFGHIASLPSERDGFKSVFLADLTIEPGNSGGPVFDKNGNVLGITNAVAILPLGFTVQLLNITYIVPTSAICEAIKLHGGDIISR